MLARHCVTAITLAAGALAPQSAEAQQGRARPDSAILAIERRGWEAVKRKDTRAVLQLAGGSFLYVQPTGIQRWSLATTPNAFAECETRSYAIDSAAVTPVGATAAVLTYRLTLDQTCGGQKVPTGFYSTVVYERRAGGWALAVRTDTPIEQSGAR